ncbi:hypothetical protein FDE82_04575 [Clostridium botulinum]|nr:hypothetical protein [Clostridium botulinum]
MNDLKEIISAIESNKFYLEYTVDTEPSRNVILGALKEKENPTGWGRHEFVIENKEEQIQFLSKMIKIMSNNI